MQAEGAVMPAAAVSPPSTLAAQPSRRRRLPYVLLYLLPVASLVYLFLLPHHPLIAQRIYTDENAWAADGAREAITTAEVQHAQLVQRRLMTADGTAETAAVSVRDVVARVWREMGMDVHSYCHHHDPRGRWAGNSSELTYATVPSRMGDGKEAVALVVDYDPRQVRASAAETTMSAVAVVSGLAQYLLGQQQLFSMPVTHPANSPSRISQLTCLFDICAHGRAGVPWLARDVLLIAVENNGNKHRAIDALGGWLHTYRSPASHSHHHNISLPSSDSHPSSSSSPSSFTFYRSGSILAALCLDIPLNTPLTSTFTLHVGGLYGLSPNLDIVSVILQMLHRRGLSVSVADTFPPHSPLSSTSTTAGPDWLTDEYRGLLRSMVHHVTGEATGFHGHFIAHNIDAVTLQALPPVSHRPHGHSYHSPAGFTGALLLALDTFCHSLNNLIEKLHHSTWLYLLVSPTHFVTMSKYVYAFALLATPLPLLALMRLYGSGQKRWMQAGSIAVWLYAIGWSIVGAGVLMRGVGGTVVQAAVMLSMAGGSALVGATTTSWWRSGDELDWRTLQAVVLLTTFFVVSPLAILNFPLSIGLLACIVPLAVHVRPIERAVHRWSMVQYGVTRLSQLVVLLLCSPVTLLAVYVVYWRLSVVGALTGLLDGLSHMGNLLYLLLPGIYLPVYMMSWMLWFLPSSAAAEPANAAATAVEEDKKHR